MTKKSSGVLLYRLKKSYLEILLLHPGGPFYSKKDLGVWSIPKGEFEEEKPQLAAIREFEEETGVRLEGDFVFLDEVTMKSGKVIYCWAKEGDFDTKLLKSNLFELEWPPKSGRIQSFPEMDKGEWFIISDAKLKIHPSQIPFIDRLILQLNLSDDKIFPKIETSKKDNWGQLDLF